MIRALVDTNVLASGFAGLRSPGSTPGAIIDHWQAGQFELVISAHILTELRRTLAKPYFASHRSSPRFSAALHALTSLAIVVMPTGSVAGVASHPEDDVVLGAAVEAEVDYLVTGDRQLQQLGTVQGVSIVSPRLFLDLLERDDS